MNNLAPARFRNPHYKSVGEIALDSLWPEIEAAMQSRSDVEFFTLAQLRNVVPGTTDIDRTAITDFLRSKGVAVSPGEESDQ